MTQKANFFKLGLFVIIAFGLGATFLIIFGSGQFFKKELLAETYFNESVQGLSIGSEVKYKGIKIGTVKSITSAARVYRTKSDYVLVIFTLDENAFVGQTGKTAKIRFEQALKDGLTIRLAFKGLTGVAYLETDYKLQNTANILIIAWKPENIYIPSQRSNIKQMGDALNQIIDNLAAINLKGITKDIESLLKSLDQKFANLDTKRISGLTSSLLTELKDTNQKVNTIIKSAKFERLVEDAQVSFSELKNLVQSSRKPLGSAIEDFQKAASSTRNMTTHLEDKLSPKVDSLATNLDRLMKSLAGTSDLLGNMVWLNSDRIELILENLETTTENLKQMSKALKRYPGRLLFENPPKKTDMETIE